jgi:FkbM family methyltransferase
MYNKPTVLETKYGFKVSGVTGDVNMAYNLAKHGLWEQHVAQNILDNVKAWDTVLDIGANIGIDSMLMSQSVGKNGKVYSFEPSQRIFKTLSENINTINTFEKNIELINKWVGSKVETVQLYMDTNNPGGTSICHNYGWSSESIEIITIDSLQLGKVDFIKMDIEGYEYEAFLWMKNLLEDNAAIKIIFEWSPQFYANLSENWKEYSINILTYLAGLWFTLYEVSDKNIWEKYEITNFEELYNKVWTAFAAHSDIYAERKL